jgi:hypothetical protein
MGNILDFNSDSLNKMLSSKGIRSTWLALLAALIGEQSKSSYILEAPEFKGVKAASQNLLAGLSIGDIGVLYEYSVAYLDPSSRKKNGQYFTPDDVASLMAKKAKKFPKGVWLDPCSGIGNLSWHLVNLQPDPEAFLRSSIVLSDKDALALLVARVLFTISFERNSKDLFFEIESKFVVFDFLSVSDTQTLGPNENDLMQIPAHDYVIVNPPYLAIEQDARFETGRAGDLYAYFLENIIKTSKGFVSVTPQSFTNAEKFRSLRHLLLRSYPDITIYVFDNVPANLFRGIKFGSRNTNTANSVRAAITIAKSSKVEKRRITSLLRWRSDQRHQLLDSLDSFLATVHLTEDYFPKVNSVFLQVYLESTGSHYQTLGSYCSSRPTEFELYVPTSPRYFISALRNPVDRSSQRTLYFRTKKDMDMAYLLINSSYMYWWWRVRDGGMTLSQETLFSLPVPPFANSAVLVKKLEESEKLNKVYKQNAGAPRENVKHPQSLIVQVTSLVMPRWASLLLLTHENSEFAQLPKSD